MKELLLDCTENDFDGAIMSEAEVEWMEDDFALTIKPPKKFTHLLVTNRVSTDGNLVLMGSFDGKNFGIVIMLKVNGEPVNVNDFIAQISEQAWGERIDPVAKNLESLWKELGDVPIDENECIEESWLIFEKGTHREEIWHWFDERYPGGVYKLMYRGEE